VVGDADVTAQQHLFDDVELLGAQAPTLEIERTRSKTPREEPRRWASARGVVERRTAWARCTSTSGIAARGGERARRDGGRRRTRRRQDDHHQHRDDDQRDDHADSTLPPRFTRWLTTLEDAPGPMVTP
jgi:hypothetical protein